MPVPWELLYPIQKEAILHNEGKLLLLAGPGTGKTEVLTQRFANLIINEKVDPEKILAITFSRKATAEMSGRLRKYEELSDLRLNVSTLHGISLNILSNEGLLRKFLAADDEVDMILRDAIEDIVGKKAYSERRGCKEYIGLKKANNIIWDECDDDQNKRIYKRLEDLLEYNNIQDLSGMVMKVIRNVKDLSDIYDIEHLLIDEYQDINRSEYELIKMLDINTESLFVVGDDDQSIYGFRGADPKIIHEFIGYFDGAERKILEESRRCTSHILEAAKEIVRKSSTFIEKPLKSDLGEGNRVNILVSTDGELESEWVSDRIFRMVNSKEYEPKDVSIIVKTLNLAQNTYNKLQRKGVRCLYWRPNMMFKDKAVKEILSFIRLFIDREDNVALRSCMNAYKGFGIGKKGMYVLKNIAEKNRIPIWEILINADDYNECGRWKKNYLEFANKINELNEKLEDMGITEFIDYIINEINIKENEQVSKLKEMIDEDEMTSLLDFYIEYNKKRGIELGQDNVELDDDNAVNIMSLHASKGLGFEVVFILGLDEEIFPNLEQDIEEQRRLCYVAMTRAEKELFMCYSTERTGPFAQGHSYYQPSRFIREISNEHANVIYNQRE